MWYGRGIRGRQPHTVQPLEEGGGAVVDARHVLPKEPFWRDVLGKRVRWVGI